MKGIIAVYIGMLAGLAWFLMRQRSNRLAHADAILRRMTDPELKVEYVRFSSLLPRRKSEIMKARIQSAAAEGWTYLKATSAPVKMTLHSLGGGLNLHFVRERQKAQKEIK